MSLLFVIIIIICVYTAFTRGTLLSFRRRGGIYLFLLRTHLGAINFPENKLLFLRGFFIFYSFPFLFFFKLKTFFYDRTKDNNFEYRLVDRRHSCPNGCTSNSFFSRSISARIHWVRLIARFVREF